MEHSNIIFEAVVSAVIGVAGWMGRVMYKKLEAVENNLDNFKLHVVTYYVDKNDFRDAMREIKDAMTDLKKVVREDVGKIVDKLDDKADK